jgi:hypothetical protein
MNYTAMMLLLLALSISFAGMKKFKDEGLRSGSMAIFYLTFSGILIGIHHFLFTAGLCFGIYRFLDKKEDEDDAAYSKRVLSLRHTLMAGIILLVGLVLYSYGFVSGDGEWAV